MKKFAFLSALVLTLALTGHAQAQDKMSGGKMSGGKMATAVTQSFTGTIKGTPSGKTFVMEMKKSTMAVDASKAKIRVNGKFAKMDMVKSGEAVTAIGKMVGKTFMADTVVIAPAVKTVPPTVGKMGKIQ